MKNALAVLACVGVFLAQGSAHAGAALDRVKESNTIHCGYVTYEPALFKDFKTKEFSGFDYDIVKAIADRLLLKVDYTTPTGWATVPPDLEAQKFDMLCSTEWVNPKAAKYMLYSRPVFFQPIFIVARANDARFDNSFAAIDDKKISLAVLEGDNPVFIAKTDFPKATLFELPNMTDFSQVLETVATGKADITIVDANTFGTYDSHNPGKLKIVNPKKPVRIYPASYGFQLSEVAFRDAVDAALNELILDGSIDRILDKYEKYPNAIYRATVDFRNPYKN